MHILPVLAISFLDLVLSFTVSFYTSTLLKASTCFQCEKAMRYARKAKSVLPTRSFKVILISQSVYSVVPPRSRLLVRTVLYTCTQFTYFTLSYHAIKRALPFRSAACSDWSRSPLLSLSMVIMLQISFQGKLERLPCSINRRQLFLDRGFSKFSEDCCLLLPSRFVSERYRCTSFLLPARYVSFITVNVFLRPTTSSCSG